MEKARMEDGGSLKDIDTTVNPLLVNLAPRFLMYVIWGIKEKQHSRFISIPALMAGRRQSRNHSCAYGRQVFVWGAT
jgi:hypothetical protein